MVDIVTARMQVWNVEKAITPDGVQNGENITLHPVYSSDPASPNYSFSQATPSGNVQMWISNPGGLRLLQAAPRIRHYLFPDDQTHRSHTMSETPAVPNTALQNAITTTENVINTLAPIVSAIDPAAAPVVSGVEAAEAVGNAVSANLAGHTAASDVAVALTTLASTPIVQSSPVLASKLTGFALLFHNFLVDLGVTK